MSLVVTPFHPGDAEQAFRQAAWIHDLSGVKGHDLLLIADTRCPATQIGAVRDEYAKSYDSVEVLDFVDHYRKWPESPNQVFGLAARHIMRTKPQPWLFLEPDAVPLKTGWLNELWAEYQKAGKPFMGDFVSAETAGINVVDHMSGNAIWPADMFTHAGLTLIADIAFDVAGASQIVPQMAKTKLIQHKWQAPPFESWQQVEERIRPEAVIFHASKDGSLIQLLRERKQFEVISVGGAESKIDPHGVTVEPPKFNPDSTAIFIKTYPPDAAFLRYCLRSINKFCAGFKELVIVHPPEQTLAVPTPNVSWHRFPRDEYGEDGYLSQQCHKLHADAFTDSEFLCFVDSDTVFTRPVTPDTYFKDGKIVWMHTPWKQTNTPWRPIVEKFMDRPIEFEFMRRFPVLVPCWMLAAVREFCLERHKVLLDQYIMAQPFRAFTEFNILGAFAYTYHRNQFYWINTVEVPESEWPELTVDQRYSWGGLTPEIEAEFERILSPAIEPVSPEPNVAAETLTQDRLESVRDALDIESADQILLNIQTPWADKDSSLAEIGRLSSRLKQFCTHPSRVRAVRLALHEAGVIQLPYRFKKHAKWRKKKH